MCSGVKPELSCALGLAPACSNLAMSTYVKRCRMRRRDAVGRERKGGEGEGEGEGTRGRGERRE